MNMIMIINDDNDDCALSDLGQILPGRVDVLLGALDGVVGLVLRLLCLKSF
jgi:hypothetical protein